MPLPTAHTPTKWTDRFALDLALSLEGSGEPVKELLKEYNISVYELEQFAKDPFFENKVSDFRTQLKEKGLSFRLKAKAQAEELLTTSWNIIHDSMVSPAVKADLIKSTVKWAGLEIQKEQQGDGDSRGVVININMGEKI